MKQSKFCGHWSSYFICSKNSKHKYVKRQVDEDTQEDETVGEKIVTEMNKSNEEMELAEEKKGGEGKYARTRAKLDYSYHKVYERDREWLQDSIIDTMVGDLSVKDTTPSEPWLIYMMGSLFTGKNFALKTFEEKGSMPLLSYVLVDVDEVRHLLPEFKAYNSFSGDRKEAGLICEIAEAEAMDAGKNVIVNCNPLQSDWYHQQIARIRTQYPSYRIAIIHVTASTETILQNLSEDEKICDLTVPTGMIQEMLDKIPHIFEELKSSVDYTCEISISENEVTVLPDNDWESFRSTWMQSPKHGRGFSRELQRKASLLALDVAPPKPIRARRRFSTLCSTEDNYQSSTMEFFGCYKHIRSTLDYNYHRNYTKQRQLLQDRIISQFIGKIIIEDKNGNLCTTPTEPFIVFTAGAMGAGKGHTIKKLVEWGYFPLLAFVIVDPDEIRRFFPEYNMYLESCPEHAGTLTRKEAGYVAEILTAVALQQNKNVLVDGSLRDSDWYKVYFKQLRDSYPVNKLAIIHVTAPRDTIFQRAEERGARTGRIVPKETLLEAIEQVPHSVNVLKHLVDVYVEINNPSDADIHITSNTEMDWDTFTSLWLQTCAYVSKRNLSTNFTSGRF